jgi:hypothetical protein
MGYENRKIGCLYLLVGGFKHEFYFPFHIWDVILPIDELIFFKMVETTNQYEVTVDYITIINCSEMMII